MKFFASLSLSLSLCFSTSLFTIAGSSAWAGRIKTNNHYLFPTKPMVQGLDTLTLPLSQQKAPQDIVLPLRPSFNDADDAQSNPEGGVFEDQNAEHLEDVQHQATVQSYALKAAQKETEAAKKEIYRSFSKLLPKIEGIASRDWAREENSYLSSTTPRYFQEDKANISLSMPLITGGRTLFGIKKAQAAAKAAQANFMATSFQLELEATQAYLSVIKDRQIERSLQQAKQALSKTLHATKMRYQAGDASKTDIALATSAYAAMEAEYYNAQMQKQYSETALRSLIQRRPQTHLAKPKSISAFGISLLQARQLVLKRNPTLIMAFHKAEVAKHNIGIERSASLPQLSLSGRYAIEKKDQDDSNNKDSFEKDYRLGFNLRVPLFDAESLVAVKISRDKAAAHYYNALDTRRKILKEFESDWQSFRFYRHKKQAVIKQVRALNHAIIGLEQEYKAGLRPVTDILTYQVNKVRAEVSLAQTDFEGHILHQRILLATGKFNIN